MTTRKTAVTQAARLIYQEVWRLCQVQARQPIATFAGPRTGAVELECGEHTGKVIAALSANNCSAVRHLLWDFCGEPTVYLSGRAIRIEAQWAQDSGLIEDRVPLSSLALHPVKIPVDRLTRQATCPCFTIGKLDDGDTMVLCFDDTTPHYAVIGTSGCGKSVLLASLVAQVAPQVDLLICDMKMDSELADTFNKVPRLFPVANDAQAALAMLQWAVEEMDNRFANMSKQRPERRIVLVVDEVADLAQIDGASKLLSSLARKGRGAGIHLVLATQHPSVASFGGSDVLKNCAGRLVGHVTDNLESYLATGLRTSHYNAAALGMRGHFLVVVPGQVRTVQVAFLDSGYTIPQGECKIYSIPEYDNRLSSAPIVSQNTDNRLLAAAVKIVQSERAAGTPDIRIGRGKLASYCEQNGIACPGDKNAQVEIMKQAKAFLDELNTASVCLETQPIPVTSWPGANMGISKNQTDRQTVEEVE